MDGRPPSAAPKHTYQHTGLWSSASAASGPPRQQAISPLEITLPVYPYPVDLYPVAHFLHYKQQVILARAGLALPTLQVPEFAVPRTRSTIVPRFSAKDGLFPRSRHGICHGNSAPKPSDPVERVHITLAKEASRMSGKKLPAPAASSKQHQPSSQPQAAVESGALQSVAQSEPLIHSSSLPSTPHQHARKFSFESREPSPTATHNHSPRSAYSEANGNVPSLRPLPPQGGCQFETTFHFPRRRMPYSLGTDRLDWVDPARIKSKLSRDEERKLETDMRELYDRLLPTKEVDKNRQKLVQKLEKLFNTEWPGQNIQVHLFGSSGSLLCSDDSDVDICITTGWKELEGVCLIAELLGRRGMEQVVCVSSAKVPIVKIWDPELRLACDMNVNNTLALENTRMVRTYVDMDERVRPLAMIIKYWTRRRIVNDAAFGATLSSYTWICMIIAFLQLRDPPVLPALHQRDEKVSKSDGSTSEFADDLSKLRGFGEKNTESLSSLLFQFFKFYAHDFDYDQNVLSIRLGKLLRKKDKKWHLAANNMLCVEEPFNTARNLGNTADDTSFRGLHLELRRAFDLLAEGKFHECCEEYVFPKEEERIFQKPAPQPRPILVRSASQQQPTRGMRGAFRGRGQYSRGANNNGATSRRASSSMPYDPSANGMGGYVPVQTAQGVMPATLSASDMYWVHAQNSQLVGHSPEAILSAMTLLAAQENNLRFQQYTLAQHINQQQQVLAHAQRMQSDTQRLQQPGTPQTTDNRTRTNSFDTPPLSAPVRPDVVLHYGYPYQAQPYYVQAGIQNGGYTHPSSPATATPSIASSTEFRRSLHRGTVTNDLGASTGSGALRSQSQPASRTSVAAAQPVRVSTHGQTSAQTQGGVTANPHPPRNGLPSLSFMADEAPESETEDMPMQSLPDSPPDDDGPRFLGYYVHDPSPNQRMQNHGLAVSALGEAGAAHESMSFGRRRPSTDLPQSILDRRMRRTSQSPPPVGHARALSVGTKPDVSNSANFALSGGKYIAPPSRGPPVANGTTSVPKTVSYSTAASSRQPSITDSDDLAREPSLRTSQGRVAEGQWTAGPVGPVTPFEFAGPLVDRVVAANGLVGGTTDPGTTQGYLQPVQAYWPGVVDSAAVMQALPNRSLKGSSAIAPVPSPATASIQQVDPKSFQQRLLNGPLYAAMAGGSVWHGLPSAHGGSHGLTRQQQNAIAPLDLATTELAHEQVQHLSPVYEHSMPSQTFPRKFDNTTSGHNTGASISKDRRSATISNTIPASPASRSPGRRAQSIKQQEAPSFSALEVSVNGHNKDNAAARGSMAQNEQKGGSWQKPKNRKKGPADSKHLANGVGHGEKPPTNDDDRKGG